MYSQSELLTTNPDSMKRTKDELLLECIEQFKHMEDVLGFNRLSTTISLIEEIRSALRIHDVVVQSEQLPCSHCGRPLKEHSKDSKLCPDRMKNFEQNN
jgi:hypothetical protein